MYTLAIEAANKTLSVAVLTDKEAVSQEAMHDMLQHSVHLAPMVQRVCQQANIQPNAVEQIIVSNGPGSYTGLRIGVTFAKTLAYTLNIPLFSVSSLHVLAQEYATHADATDQLVVSFFDARRANVYAGCYVNGQSVREDQHCTFESVLAYCQQQDKAVVFVSPDIATFQPMIDQANFTKPVTCALTYPSAVSVASLMANATQVDPHTHVPTYLKLAEAEEKWLENSSAVEMTALVERGDFS